MSKTVKVSQESVEKAAAQYERHKAACRRESKIRHYIKRYLKIHQRELHDRLVGEVDGLIREEQRVEALNAAQATDGGES